MHRVCHWLVIALVGYFVGSDAADASDASLAGYCIGIVIVLVRMPRMLHGLVTALVVIVMIQMPRMQCINCCFLCRLWSPSKALGQMGSMLLSVEIVGTFCWIFIVFCFWGGRASLMTHLIKHQTRKHKTQPKTEVQTRWRCVPAGLVGVCIV
jgi:hypothetical protein